MIKIPLQQTKTFGKEDAHAHFILFVKSNDQQWYDLRGIYKQIQCGQGMTFTIQEFLQGSDRINSIFNQEVNNLVF